MIKISRTAAALACAATLSLVATPALARDRDGWGNGWGGGRHHHNDGIDGGDILTGLLILGGIAIIADAATKDSNSRQRQRPGDYPDQSYPEPAYQQPAYAGYGEDNRPQWQGNNGINSAIGRCMDEIDRGKPRVDSVDAVSRTGDGWRVEGRVDGGSSFSCTVSEAGQIEQVSVDGRAL